MLGMLLEANLLSRRIITGRVFSGSIRTNAPVKVLDRNGDLVEQGRVPRILAFRGIERAIDEALAGDIVAIAKTREVQRRRHAVQPGRGRTAARPADRPADAVDDLLVNGSPLAEPRATR